MVAPPLVTVSSGLPQPCTPGQPMKKGLLSDSTPSQLCFPNEFPYDFDSPTFSSPEYSTATEDETSDDEDDFLAGLTRRLALSTQRLSSPPSFVADKPEVKPSEPTPSGLVSPNGPFSQAPSPPTSPFREKEDSLKVISAAAGEVAKMANSKPTSRQNPNPNSFTAFPQDAAFYSYWLCQPQNSHYHQSQIRVNSTSQQSSRRLPNGYKLQTQAGLCRQPASIAPHFPVRGVHVASNAVKQPSGGTGVFVASNARPTRTGVFTASKAQPTGTGVLTASNAPPTGTGVFFPRKYPNPSDSKKKSGGGCVKVPTKAVVQKQQKPKLEEFSGRCQPHSQARLSKGRGKINYAVTGGSLKK